MSTVARGAGGQEARDRACYELIDRSRERSEWNLAAREARLALGGFVVSHLPMMLGLFETTVGEVAIIHLFCYSPALISLARRRSRVAPGSPFGIWVHVMLVVLSISLAFDLRDSVRFLFA